MAQEKEAGKDADISLAHFLLSLPILSPSQIELFGPIGVEREH
jgi:hypothetical protein